MNDHPSNKQNEPQGKGFAAFLLRHLVVALILIAAALYGLSVGIDYLQTSDFIPETASRAHTPAMVGAFERSAPGAPAPLAAMEAQNEARRQSDHATQTPPASGPPAAPPMANEPPSDRMPSAVVPAAEPPKHSVPPPHGEPSAPADRSDSHAVGAAPAGRPAQTVVPPPAYRPSGVAFVESVIKPIDYELNRRFWGWRPNDIVNLTDNINQHQLGVLEVTRRTVVQLAERISRTGYNDAFDRNLENAMNWLMIKATSYWFPAPEAKYKESLAELEIYKRNLMNKAAFFYTRSDNLIPLLAAFEDLLGSCDQNLVKTKEGDGSTVGFTRADNYFYYAKGVSSAMATILEAVSLDFAPVLNNRNGAELIHHAISSCRLAASLEPWIITNGDLDGILANHRAHIAAPISHARFYLGQLIKTLST
ncbi:MAG: DUF2333 family protein [Desulfobacteraceae bacterium]|nr:MAG: DUF2333 family protein [Desulfobacteraceae bacterium]